jgi:hypothetical protein
MFMHTILDAVRHYIECLWDLCHFFSIFFIFVINNKTILKEATTSQHTRSVLREKVYQDKLQQSVKSKIVQKEWLL